MIKDNVQQFLDHCVHELKVDTISHTTHDQGDSRWDEVATIGNVVMTVAYTDRDYPGDRRVNIRYVVGSEYTFKVYLDKFLTLTRADIERVGDQAAILNKRYLEMMEELKVFPADAKKTLQQMLT